MTTKPLDKHSSIVNIINAMTEQGFMSGALGDTSEDFKADQQYALAQLQPRELFDWLMSNKFNICHYCKLQAEWEFLLETVS